MDTLKYNDVNPDDAKKMAQRMHVKKDEIQLCRKGYEVKAEDANDEDRTIVARVSTSDRDRDGEIIEPNGIDVKDYQKNPVLLWAHQYDQPAIGKALWSKTDDKGLVCKFQFAPTQFAEDIYQLYKGGYQKAFSIGFIPMEFDQKTKTHQKTSLLEVSAVPVPANQNALVMEAYQKGLIKSDALKKELGVGDEPETQAIQEPAVPVEPVTQVAPVETTTIDAPVGLRFILEPTKDAEPDAPAPAPISLWDIISADDLKQFILQAVAESSRKEPDPDPAPQAPMSTPAEFIELEVPESIVDLDPVPPVDPDVDVLATIETLREFVRSGEFGKLVKETVEVEIARARGRVL